MNAKDIKELIREKIAYETKNINDWREEIRDGLDFDGNDIQEFAQRMELSKEYRKALRELQDDIERREERGL